MLLRRKNHINNLVLRFRRKGCRFYPLYDIVVLKKNTRGKSGKYIDILGIYNPNYNNRFLYFNSSKFFFWLERGIIVNYKVKNYLLKFLL